MFCLKCSNGINQASDKSYIKCDGCSRPIHVHCSELSASELKCFELRSNSKRRIKYICIECEQGVHQIPKLVSMINDLKDELLALKNRLNVPPPPISNECAAEEIIEEIAERSRRSFNLLVFGSVELGKTRKEQLDLDEALTTDMLEGLELPQDNIKSVRIGKYDSTKTSRARPIRIRMNGPDDVLHAVRGFKSLKSSPRFSGISIGFDGTPKQVAYYKSIKAQLDARATGGETNLFIKYKNLL